MKIRKEAFRANALLLLAIFPFTTAGAGGSGRTFSFKTDRRVAVQQAGFVPQTTLQPKPKRKTKKRPKRKAAATQYAVPSGIWGGDGIRLTVTADGATIEYACADGLIEQTLKIDAKGNFVAKGVHIEGRGGPIRIDDEPTRRPARYSGRIAGEEMTLTVTLTESGKSVGEFVLRRGQVPHLRRCY